MKKYKTFGLVASYHLILAILCWIVFLGGITLGADGVLKSLRYDKMRTDVNELDQALMYYSMGHHGVDSTLAGLGEYEGIPRINADDVTSNGIYDDGHTVKLLFTQGPKFPTNTDELGLLLTQFGYLAHEIDAVQGAAWEIYSTEESQRKMNWYERGNSSGFNGATLTYSTRYKYTHSSTAPNGQAGYVQEYSLTLRLPNGEIYKSPHSAY